MRGPPARDMSDNTTHFGFERVPERDKTRRVRSVFESVASRYDLMNDLMSFGLHRLWKRFALEVSGVRAGAHVLDLAAGTGDLAAGFARRVGRRGTVTLVDLSPSMLAAGRRRLTDAGFAGNLRYVQADAQRLPFASGCFDCASIAFGLRNVTRPEAALSEMRRVLRPGATVLVLEFSALTVPALAPVYDAYSFQVLPRLGRVVAGDAAAYRYLAESIRMHPEQARLQALMESAGFERCGYFNLTAGVVALHRGYRL